MMMMTKYRPDDSETICRSPTEACRANAASPQPTLQLTDVSAIPVYAILNGTSMAGYFTNEMHINRMVLSIVRPPSECF